MNKNRDMFLDLMEEINHEHLETHIKRNTDTKSKKIKRYILAAGIYAAACVAALLLIPVVMNHTGIAPSDNTPGAEPVVTEPMADEDDAIDEFFANTKLYKVLATAGVERKDVESLQVGDYMIVDGDVYYLFDGIYKNTEETPIYTRNNPNLKYPIETFTVTGDYIICEVDEDPNKVEQDLYCYNMKTGEEILVCSDDIYHYDVYDGKVVYLTADSINNINEVKVYTYDPETNRSTYVCDLPDTHHYIADICYGGSGLALTIDTRYYATGYYTTCQAYILDGETGNLRDLFPSDFSAKLAITAADEGYYVAYQKIEKGDDGLPKELDCQDNGVWYTDVWGNPVKVSDNFYAKLYYVNGALVGVNGDEITLIVEKPTEEEIYGLEEGKLFPRPETIVISCEYDHRRLTSGDPLYEYIYEKINARVKDGSLEKLTDRNHTSPNEYRKNKEVYVAFDYFGDSWGAPFYPDKENSDTVFTPGQLFFPLTGDNTDTVLFNHRNESDELVTWCFGTLADDPEIEAKILEFFSYAVTE